MNAVTKIKEAVEVDVDPLAKLREPFPTHHVSKLPKETKKQREEREADRSKGVNCTVCGGWHHRNAVHLDYVGHAALTDRLLDVDPNWFWEPMALRDGLPAFDQTGGLWIRLTVAGMSRIGYGHAAPKPQMDAGSREKEVIGDALRNAAMRFGAALDLWHKGDLHIDETESGPSAYDLAANLLRSTASGPEFKETWEKNIAGWKGVMSPDELTKLAAVKNELTAKFVKAAAEQVRADAEKAKAAQGEPLSTYEDLNDEIPF